MPVVTVDPNNYVRKELKSAPADPNKPGDEPGYVMVRPLPYGLKLTRRDNATKMAMEVESGKRSRKQQDQTQKFDLTTMSDWAVQFDFEYCVGDHNLLDSAGNKLDFANPMTYKLLDPKVGSEIENILNDLNEDVDEESLEDFIKRSTSPSQEEDTTSTVLT
jgi:hypothetical protein